MGGYFMNKIDGVVAQAWLIEHHGTITSHILFI